MDAARMTTEQRVGYSLGKTSFWGENFIAPEATAIPLFLRSLYTVLGIAEVILFVPRASVGCDSQPLWEARDVQESELQELWELLASHLNEPDAPSESEYEIREKGDWNLLIAKVQDPNGRSIGVLAAGCRRTGKLPWAPEHQVVLNVFAGLCGMAAKRPNSFMEQKRSLDCLVTQIATRLMSVSSADLDSAIEWVLQLLTEFFGIDTSFLRRTDHERDVSSLVAEWPPRENVPVPDPLADIPFGMDPVFTATKDLDKPYIVRPSESPETYQELVLRGSGISEVSLAMVPMRRDSLTIGVLGFIKVGDRSWDESEINALQAVASLVVQLQSRVEAEEKLHDQGLAHSLAERQRSLDSLITRVATRLMAASTADLNDSIEWVLQILTEFFGVDTSFLRRNDYERSVSVLEAEWPHRENIPDPDPLGEVPFGADPVCDAPRELRRPFVIRPGESPDTYQERVQEGSGVGEVSLAMVPLIKVSVTVGVLGFVKFGDRPWDESEINALQAIAALIVQLQSRVDAEDRLHYQANHDELTGLPNRRALMEELEERLKQVPRQKLALMFLDLDRFKSTNDSLGHSAGDQLLVAVAERLRSCASSDDFVARLAGDEFVLVLDCKDPRRDVQGVAEELRNRIARLVEIGGRQVSRTVSVGIAESSGQEAGPDDLLGQADAALHKAKSAGGNQVVIFDQILRASFRDQSNMEFGLRDAMHDGKLILFYQPEFDLRTGELLALEALVRWNHPERGILPAGAFIKVAEEAGLVVSLGQWVLSEATRQIAEWRGRYPKSQFVTRVNMSPAQLATDDVVLLLQDSLTTHGVPGHAICLEITEHAVMRDVEQSLKTLHALKSLGVSLAIDDFGTGYSSMSQLKRLPVSTLKIDQSFVAGLGHDFGDRAIIDATLRLAQSFGLDVVAEGVENNDTVRELLGLGCYRAQGYLLSHPKPVSELEALIKGGHISDLDSPSQLAM